MTVFANVIDGQIKGVFDLLPKEWNGVLNFDVKAANNAEFMKENGFVKIVRDATPFDSATHKMSDFPTYTVENDQVIEHREILALPPEPTPSVENEIVDLVSSDSLGDVAS